DEYRIHYGKDALISDAGSEWILMRELMQPYRDPEAQLPPPDITFRDYVSAQQQLRNSGLYARSRQYWLQRLESIAPPPQLPLSRRPEEIRQPRFKSCSYRLEHERWQKLQDEIQGIGITPAAFLVTLFAHVL